MSVIILYMFGFELILKEFVIVEFDVKSGVSRLILKFSESWENDL